MSTSLTETALAKRALVDIAPPNGGGISRSLPLEHAFMVGLERDDGDGASEEPPLKRPRLEGNGAARRQSLKMCLQEQVLPHVIQAVQCLPSDLYRVDDIAVRVVAQLAKSQEFGSRLNEVSGLLTPETESIAGERALEIVKELAVLPEYQADLRHAGKLEAVDQFRGPDEPPPKPVEKAIRPAYKRSVKNEGEQSRSQRPQLQKRPYVSAHERTLVRRGVTKATAKASVLGDAPNVYHVDFTAQEVSKIVTQMSKYLNFALPNTTLALKQLCQEYHVSSIVDGLLQGRTEQDVRNFCSDLLADQASESARAFSLNRATAFDSEQRRASITPSMLLAREIEGNRGFGRTRHYANFQDEFRKAHEDGFSVVAEFTNCAGDIATATWVPDNNILCGTTAHSDSHNQQYNKPGNLLLCSTSLGVLRAFPDHRVPRPLVDKGENSTEAMRLSQDPWLYSSVVSSDYDPTTGLAFTSSFDKTVKVWRVDPSGKHMEAAATWRHVGNVNFVAAAKDGSGRVVAAADAPTDAIRVYTINRHNIQASSYFTIASSRTDADSSEDWAYCPATVQWGKAPGTQHLLAIGYSPRSLTNDEQAIPADKKNSGEIAVCDTKNRRRVPVMTATTANAFEIVWHPTLPRFIVATSPCGLDVDQGVRTQIHVFRCDRDGAYSEMQKLDCYASDINELAITPSSINYAYISAACTDGKVYVWDTAQGDKPIHILKHGYPLDEFSEDREREDTGVKFVSWSTSIDRMYTGSSDGVVKVWNVRNKRKPFVQNLLHAPGPIACGTFSPDYSQLAIGDATGRLFLLSIDMENVDSAITAPIPGSNRRIRRPKPFTPHPEPPPPVKFDQNAIMEPTIGAYARRTFLDTEQLTIHHNPVIGAVQGPAYASTNLFRHDAHLDGDPAAPLMTPYERLQQESRHGSMGPGVRSRLMRRMRPVKESVEAEAQHSSNANLGLDLNTLSEEDMSDLVKAGALLNMDEDWGFEYEEERVDE